MDGFPDMRAKRGIALTVLVAFLFVTGMAPLCVCRCCDRADAAGREAQLGAESEDCCNTEAMLAAPENRTVTADAPHTQRLASQTGVSACSCDMTPPAKLTAVAVDSTVSMAKMSPGLIVIDQAVSAPTSGYSRDAIAALSAWSVPHASAFLLNCSFLC